MARGIIPRQVIMGPPVGYPAFSQRTLRPRDFAPSQRRPAAGISVQVKRELVEETLELGLDTPVYTPVAPFALAITANPVQAQMSDEGLTPEEIYRLRRLEREAEEQTKRIQAQREQIFVGAKSTAQTPSFTNPIP